MGANSKPAKPTRKKRATISPLREIVGDEVYDVWVKMLSNLVPDGRTHRLSVVVASMLTYASDIASAKRGTDKEDHPAYPLLVAFEGLEEDEALRLLTPMLNRLFKDAGVKYERVSSKGERYSILWEATIEFCRWYNYQWE